MASKFSGIQKEVLSLYRRILREAVKKDRAANAGADAQRSVISFLCPKGIPTTTSYATPEFRRQVATTKRSDFKKIEYMIRKGEKHLKLLQMPGVKVVHGIS
jgi:succinate dehydrogenase assembly factor 1